MHSTTFSTPPSTSFGLQEHPTSAFNDESDTDALTISERMDSWLSVAALGVVWVSGAMALWW
jgi:hypothetical protein